MGEIAEAGLAAVERIVGVPAIRTVLTRAWSAS